MLKRGKIWQIIGYYRQLQKMGYPIKLARMYTLMRYSGTSDELAMRMRRRWAYWKTR